MFTSERVRKSIARTPSMLISANKKVSSKNWTFPSLSWTEKSVMAISRISRVEPSIFWVPMLIFEVTTSDIAGWAVVIALTSFPESSRTCMSSHFSWNRTWYWMQWTRHRGEVSELAIADVEIAVTAASFLPLKTWDNCWDSVLYYHNCSRWRSWDSFDPFLGLGYRVSLFS